MEYGIGSPRTVFEVLILCAVIVMTFRRPVVGLAALLFVSAAMISLFSFNPYVFIDLRMLRTIAIVTFIAAIIETVRKGEGLFAPLQNWLMLGILCLMCLSRLFHGLPVGAPIIDDIFKITLMYFVITAIMDSDKKMKVAIWAIVIGLALEAWTALQNSRMGITRLAIPIWFSDKNDFALSLVMGIPLAATLIMDKGNVIKKLALVGIIGLLILTIFRTHSRGAYLGMFVVILLTVIKMLKKKEWRMTALLFIPMIVGIFIFRFSGSAVDTLKSIAEYEEDPSATNRIKFWEAGLNMMKDNPLLGVGGGNFGENLPYYMDVSEDEDVEYQEQLITDRQKRSPHNMFILVGAENGIPALALWILLLIKTFSAGIRPSRAGPKTSGKLSLADLRYSVMTGLTGWVVCGLFLSPFYEVVPHALIAMMAASGKIETRNEHAAAGCTDKEAST